MLKIWNFHYYKFTSIYLSYILNAKKKKKQENFQNLVIKTKFLREVFYPLYLKRDSYIFNDLWLYCDLKKEGKNLIKFCITYDNLLFTKDYIFLVKFFQFFRRYNFDFKIIYYLLDSKYNYLWDIILLSNKKKLYYQFLINIIKEYKKLWSFFNNSKNLVYPSNYLVNFSSKYTASSLLEQGLSVNNMFLLKKKCSKSSSSKLMSLRSSIFLDLNTSNFEKLWRKSAGFDYSFSMYTIHFIRVQRRYNKRRYSKVRLQSRPSFFGGISLGSLFISCFWGGTIKSVDWCITAPIVLHMNSILSFVIVLTYIRLMIIDFSISSLHNFAKIRIYRFLKLILTNKIMKKVLNLK